MKKKIDRRRKFQIGDKAKIGPKTYISGYSGHKIGQVVKITDFTRGIYDAKNYKNRFWVYYAKELIKIGE